MEAHRKRKLRTFIKIHDFKNRNVLTHANLNRINSSLVCKLKAGVFRIRIETGRYKGTKEELGICELCTKGEVEDKIHFVFKCKALKQTRKPYIDKFYDEHGGKKAFKSKYDTLKCM